VLVSTRSVNERITQIQTKVQLDPEEYNSDIISKIESRGETNRLTFSMAEVKQMLEEIECLEKW